MPKLQYDFVSLPSKNFGIVLPLDEQIDAIPNALDVWPSAAENLTLVSGKASEWIGRTNARILGQTNAARRPVPESGLLRMSSDLQAPANQFDLAGTAIGVQTNISIACYGRIHPEQLGVDNQYFFGSSVTLAIARVAYRFTSGARYLRFQFRDSATILDVPLPLDWDGQVGIVLVVAGTAANLYLSTGGSGSITLPNAFDLQNFSVGNAIVNANGSLRGYIGNFGIWLRDLTPTERSTVMRWVS